MVHILYTAPLDCVARILLSYQEDYLQLKGVLNVTERNVAEGKMV